jgi:hypothetical protein
MKENLGPMQSPTNDSPSEVEDTPGDTVEDVAESEGTATEGDTSTEAVDE